MDLQRAQKLAAAAHEYLRRQTAWPLGRERRNFARLMRREHQYCCERLHTERDMIRHYASIHHISSVYGLGDLGGGIYLAAILEVLASVPLNETQTITLIQVVAARERLTGQRAIDAPDAVRQIAKNVQEASWTPTSS